MKRSPDEGGAPWKINSVETKSNGGWEPPGDGKKRPGKPGRGLCGSFRRFPKEQTKTAKTAMVPKRNSERREGGKPSAGKLGRTAPEGGLEKDAIESSILAQDERWRRA